MKDITFGEMRRKAMKFDELTDKLTDLILLYKISIPDIAKKTGMSSSHLYRKLNDKKLTPGQLTTIFKAIIEENILMKT